MIAFLRSRWFLVSLLGLVVLGVAFPQQIRPFAEARGLQNAIVCCVLFCMALPLEARQLWQTLRRPLAPLLAFGVNLGILPLAAWGLAPLLGPDLGPGLLVASTTPCTLASAAVWTRRAGGNDAVSVLVTILTNASCFLTMPFWLWIMTGKAVVSEDLSFGNMVYKLGLLVVLPMALAQVVRKLFRLGMWADERRVLLGVLAQSGVLSMALVGAVQTGLRLDGTSPGSALHPGAVLGMVLGVLGLHCAMFWLGYGLGGALRLPDADRVAVAFSGSQKTLMIGLVVAIAMQVSVLPMVSYHILQLFVDTVFADRMRARRAALPG